MAIKLKIDDKVYALRMDMYAMEQIEDAFGSVDEMFKKAESGSIKTISTLFRIIFREPINILFVNSLAQSLAINSHN